MIDLSKVKVVLYDFDDTLCIHKNHQCFDANTYNTDILLYGPETFKMCKPNSAMKEFMNLCKSKNIRQGLASHVLSVKHADAKNKWVKKEYGIELEDYCVGHAEGKVEMMNAIHSAYGYSKDEILIIDDLYPTLEKAANEGFQACTPMEIVNYIEDYKKY